MHTPRILIKKPLAENQEIFLDKDTAYHLVNVLRLKTSENIIVFNGQGGEYLARILEITKKQVRIIIENFQAKNISSPLNITLGQGISRGEKMDFIIQKSVELGVHTIAPIVTERSSFKLSDERQTNKLRHWQSIAIHASEQSGRCDIAQISTIQPLATWLNSQRGLCLVLDPNARNNLKHALEQSKQNNKIDAITLLIGPEGGLSADEIQLAVKYNFRPIKFGPRILRTETAGLAIVSVLQYLLGDVA